MFNNLTPVSTGIIQKNSFTNDYNCLLCLTFRWLSKRVVDHVDFWARELAVDLDVSNVNTEISKSHSICCASNLWLRRPITMTKYAKIVIMYISMQSGTENANLRKQNENHLQKISQYSFYFNFEILFFIYRGKNLIRGLLTVLKYCC